MANPTRTLTRDITAQVTVPQFGGSFTTPEIFLPNSLVVRLNGQDLRIGWAYTEAPTFDGFTMDPVIHTAPGDHLQVQYEIEDLGADVQLVVASGIDPDLCG